MQEKGTGKKLNVARDCSGVGEEETTSETTAYYSIGQWPCRRKNETFVTKQGTLIYRRKYVGISCCMEKGDGEGRETEGEEGRKRTRFENISKSLPKINT